MLQQLNIRDLVEGEGQNLITEENAESNPRVRVAWLVQTAYKPNRPKQFHDNPTVVDQGNQGMVAFAVQSLALAKQLDELGDYVAAHWARHNAASAYGTITAKEIGGVAVIDGEMKARQKELNKAIVDDLLDYQELEDMGADEFFIYVKAVVGLYEKDDEFRQDFGVDPWFETLLRMRSERYPDYPGRAEFTARMLLEDAASAEVAEFGKDQQVARVKALVAKFDS